MKKKSILLILLLLPFCAFSKTVWLDELNVDVVYQDWGTAQINKSVLGSPLMVGGKKYQRGIGTHSISRFLLNLDGKAKSISGFVGADDNNDFSGNMEFMLIADKKTIWRSGIMHKGMSAKHFSLNLENVHKVALIVGEAGDGIMYDHADWLNVKLITSGNVISESVIPNKKITTEKYILTPKEKETPKINSPKVFGVRPNSPFLYTVAATGKRPIVFSAYQLPDGLSINKETGIITGSLNKKGTYNVIVRADNELGGDFRIIKIVVGDKISLTPPMGWNSWNCWGLSVDDKKVKSAADYMSRKLINHGWTYVNIDDGWEAEKRTTNNELIGNQKFPDFKDLSDYIHSKGLKFGIYSSPGPMTCGGYLGSYKHEDLDAQTWAKWGVDYLKYDYCFYNQVVPVPTEELIKEPYIVMRKALDKVDRDITYCVGFGAPNVWNWAQEAGGNLWRTTRDITDEWNVVTAIGCFQDVCASVTKPGGYNDPDMLVVGTLGKGWGAKAHDSYLTPDEQYSHISLWCLLSAPLLIGCDMDNMDDFTLNLLTNDEVIGVDQDPLAMPAKKILTNNGQIWYKHLEDGAVAVGFFNIDPYAIVWDQNESDKIQTMKYKMTLDLSQLGLKGKYMVHDLWSQKDLGTVDNSFETEMPYHGVSFVKFVPVK
ncbi:NPCBM/NEW2 domain-containing protein [uncultured Bacteroides sp.]|uniref:NPCBM/NEW2 domain-containing protein n=1 Tax=uncultured Bacteroides sp. TaxID=162156 RepID=UPI002AABB320|nr:NPCBM/NEW2 domain-containing protein [uncultured Bacteroides sp.]